MEKFDKMYDLCKCFVGYCLFLYVYLVSLFIGKYNIIYVCGYVYFWVIFVENEFWWEI